MLPLLQLSERKSPTEALRCVLVKDGMIQFDLVFTVRAVRNVLEQPFN